MTEPVPFLPTPGQDFSTPRTTGYKGHRPQYRMQPTEGSKTQKRKANRGNKN